MTTTVLQEFLGRFELHIWSFFFLHMPLRNQQCYILIWFKLKPPGEVYSFWTVCMGESRTCTARGRHKWPMKRSRRIRAEWGGGGGGGVTPSHRLGSGQGFTPEIFLEIASKWCNLSAFWGNQYTFLTLKIYMKKCVSLYAYIDYSFFKILWNLHQNGAFWVHFNLQFYKWKFIARAVVQR